MEIIDDPTVTPDPEDSTVDALANGKSVNAALMRLVDAYGGEVNSSDTNAQLIDKLVAFAGGGDKFLAVHVLTDENDKYYLDKPAKQIYEALENGVVSILKKSNSTDTYIESLHAYSYNSEQGTYYFDVNGSYDSPFFAFSDLEYPRTR